MQYVLKIYNSQFDKTPVAQITEIADISISEDVNSISTCTITVAPDVMNIAQYRKIEVYEVGEFVDTRVFTGYIDNFSPQFDKIILNCKSEKGLLARKFATVDRDFTPPVAPAYGLSTFDVNQIENLSVYYPFNGNADDYSGNGINGTVYSATLTTNRFGRTNRAYEFDGVNSYIKLTDTEFDIYGDVSYSVGFKINTFIVGSKIFSKYAGSSTGHVEAYLASQTLGTNKIAILFRGVDLNNPLISNFSFDTGVFYDINVTYNYTTGEVKLFVNGVFDSSNMQQIGVLPNGAVFTLGAKASDNSTKLDGVIEYFRKYDRILTDEEALAISTNANFEAPSDNATEIILNTILNDWNFTYWEGWYVVTSITDSIQKSVKTGDNLYDIINEIATSLGAVWDCKDGIITIEQLLGNDYTKTIFETDIVLNGDFEYATVAPIYGPYTNWVGGVKAGNELFCRVAPSGSSYLEINNTESISGNALHFHLEGTTQYIEAYGSSTSYYNNTQNTVKPNTRYKMSGYAKSENITGSSNSGQNIRFIQSNSGGTTAGPVYYIMSGAIKVDKDWTYYESYFTTSASAAYGHIEYYVLGNSGDATLNGDFYFDQFKIEEIDASNYKELVFNGENPRENNIDSVSYESYGTLSNIIIGDDGTTKSTQFDRESMRTYGPLAEYVNFRPGDLTNNVTKYLNSKKGGQFAYKIVANPFNFSANIGDKVQLRIENVSSYFNFTGSVIVNTKKSKIVNGTKIAEYELSDKYVYFDSFVKRFVSVESDLNLKLVR